VVQVFEVLPNSLDEIMLFINFPLKVRLFEEIKATFFRYYREQEFRDILQRSKAGHLGSTVRVDGGG